MKTNKHKQTNKQKTVFCSFSCFLLGPAPWTYPWLRLSLCPFCQEVSGFFGCF
ncbi:unnamed protein product [Nyctereutes procyonoides]|uniref:(raccoon dog) hypothetical protein n=1 Tax=Nyctereutes procyonoides TaxID=34880 RepID=A0A811ZSU9_NYCPR|nr:unnamed protein product [Nyctereutes procyonoides]